MTKLDWEKAQRQENTKRARRAAGGRKTAAQRKLEAQARWLALWADAQENRAGERFRNEEQKDAKAARERRLHEDAKRWALRVNRERKLAKQKGVEEKQRKANAVAEESREPIARVGNVDKPSTSEPERTAVRGPEHYSGDVMNYVCPYCGHTTAQPLSDVGKCDYCRRTGLRS